MSAPARALNPLINAPPEALSPTVATTLEFARLLNEARILLRHFQSPELTDFENRCREQAGPIVEPRR